MKNTKFLELFGSSVSVVDYRNRERITSDLLRSNNIYFVIEGNVLEKRELFLNDTGKSISTLRGAGSMIGDELLFGGDSDQNSVTQIIAEGTAKVACIGRDTLKQLLQGALSSHTETIYLLLLQESHRKYRELVQWRDNKVGNKKQAVLFCSLQSLGNEVGSRTAHGVIVPVSVAALSSMTGLREEATRRGIDKLMGLGKIAKAGVNKWLLLDQ